MSKFILQQLPLYSKYLRCMPRSTSILVARLILNLRAVAARQCQAPTFSGELTTLTWAWEARHPSLSNAIFGNVGNELESEIDADADDEYR